MHFEVIDNRRDIGYAFKRIKSKNLYGLVNLRGEVVLEPQYEYIEEFRGNQLLTVYKNRGLLGYVGLDGQPLCEALYTKVETPLDPRSSYYADSFPLAYSGFYSPPVSKHPSSPTRYFKVTQKVDFERPPQGNGPVNYINQYGNYLLSDRCFVLMGTPFCSGKAIVLPNPFHRFVIIREDKVDLSIGEITFKSKEVVNPLVNDISLEGEEWVVLDTLDCTYTVDWDGNVVQKKRKSIFKQAFLELVLQGGRLFSAEIREAYKIGESMQGYEKRVKEACWPGIDFNV